MIDKFAGQQSHGDSMPIDPLAAVGWNMRQPEIDALRAENQRLTLADRQWADHVKRLAEENERLKAEFRKEFEAEHAAYSELRREIERLKRIIAGPPTASA